MFYNYFESQTEIRIEESAKRHKRKAVEKKHTSNVNQRIAWPDLIELYTVLMDLDEIPHLA